MKLRNSELWNLFNAVEGEISSYRKLVRVKWSGIVSYEIAKLGKKLNDQLSVVNDARMNILNRLREEGKDPAMQGNLTGEESEEVKAKAVADFAEFVTAFNEILNKEEEIEVGTIKIAKEKIPDIEPEVLLAFDRFIEVN